jgi:hypothetical protein
MVQVYMYLQYFKFLQRLHNVIQYVHVLTIVLAAVSEVVAVYRSNAVFTTLIRWFTRRPVPVFFFFLSD